MKLNELFLYSLYTTQEKIKNDFISEQPPKEIWYDQNVFNLINDFLKNNDIDKLANLLKPNNHSIFSNYDTKDNDYFNEFFDKDSSPSYYGASLAYDKYGLQKSQLKTLTSIFKCFKNDNKFISINGGPGTGKSTLLNYVISNILLNSMIDQYKKYKQKNVPFTSFIKKNYVFPKLFLTGTTKISVNNISDVCSIKTPDNHRWIYLDIDNKELNKSINNFFYSLDIKLSKDDENKTILLNTMDIEFYKHKDKIKLNFEKSFKKYFNFKTVNWNNICEFMFKKIKSNIKEINNINKNIESIFDETIQKNTDVYLKEIYLENIFNSIMKELYSFNNETLSKRERVQKYCEKIERNVNILKSNIDYSNKEVVKTLNLIEELTSQFKKLDNKFLFFKTNKSINNKINIINDNIKKLISQSGKNVHDYFEKLNKAIESIKKMFSDDEIKELNLSDVRLFKRNSNKEMLLEMIASLDIIKINFNIIQQRMDTFYRTENIYLYRHICEWLFIENNFKDSQCIKPIISSNLQNFSFKKIKIEDWDTKIEHFDYTIIDEAAQTSSKFIPFLAILSNKIIAVGDEIQLSPIENDEVNKNISLLKEITSEKEIENLETFLINKIRLCDKNESDLKFKNSSLLEWINNNSNIHSIVPSSNDKQVKTKGFVLLEHFRCPYQIFSLINEFFYNNSLFFAKGFNEEKCNLSKIISNDLTCDESSIIQIKYDDENDNENNENIKELEIGFGFIFDNIKNILKHNDKNNEKISKENIDYLKQNIAFVTLYKNQSSLMNKIIDILKLKISNNELNNSLNRNVYKVVENLYIKITKNFDLEEQKYIVNFLDSFKHGTIDSLQGIGCDFVIFSNVSNHYIKEETKLIRKFEFDINRTNVLWTRTKKHFIHIISNNYWNNISSEKIDEIEFRFESEVNSKKLNISRVVFNLKNNINNNLSINNLITKYKSFDDVKRQINEIGKYGELVFNEISNDVSFSKILSKKIEDEIGVSLILKNNIKWENENEEKYLKYDFLVDNNFFIDVKASKKNNSNEIIISKNEWIFGKENNEKYFIVKINDITKYNINIHNQSSKAFVLNNISFYKYDENKLKNNNNSIWYIFRENI